MSDDAATLVPSDAGEYADALAAILRRIPAGWGTWVSCGPGWYPLLAELDTAIAELEPDYIVEQVKEKFGTLRFYWTMPEIEPSCCVAFAGAHPRPAPGPVNPVLAPRTRTPQEQRNLEAWWRLSNEHFESSEHQAGWAATERLREAQSVRRGQIQELVDIVERRSGHVCELCGAGDGVDGNDVWTRDLGGIRKTLCTRCAAASGYPAPRPGNLSGSTR